MFRSFIRVTSFSKKTLSSLSFVLPMRGFATHTIKFPASVESISEGGVQAWVKKLGERVEVDDVVIVMETAKTNQEIRSPVAGELVKLLVNIGDNIPVGADLFIIDTDKAGSSEPVKQETVKVQPVKEESKKPEVKVETKPEPKVEPKVEPKREEPKKETKTKPQDPLPVRVFSGKREEHREKITRIRKTIADRLKNAQNTYAMLTTFQECDMSRAIELRNAYKDDFLKKHSVKLGFMSFFVKAATQALLQNPIANAVIQGDEIIYKSYIDISVAVATPNGLVVPVIRNCEQKSFADIEKEILRFSNLAKDGKLPIEDMVGGNFTISNGGVYGSLMGTPILNPPQTAILGMHSIENRAVVREDKIVARPIMYLALTYDHRLLDGKDAVLFLRSIKSMVEEPSKILLDL
jgi:2-oxoglutarate dehydrogenase E2 component (dihydrolipoamide succinyltransferase)